MSTLESAAEVWRRWQDLAERIRDHRFAYCLRDVPTISDGEFDQPPAEVVALWTVSDNLKSGRGRHVWLAAGSYARWGTAVGANASD